MAAEEGEVAVAAEGVGGAFGYLGAWQKEQQPSHPRRERLLERGCHGRSRRGGNGRVWPGAGEHALPALAGQQGRGRAGRPVRPQHERRHAAPALHAALWQQHLRQPRRRRPITRRAPLLGPEPLPQSQPNSRARSLGRQSRLPPPSYDQLARYRPRLSFAARAKMSVALHVKKHGGSHSRSTG